MICNGCGAVIGRRNIGFGVWRWVRLDVQTDARLWPWTCPKGNADHLPRETAR